MWYRYIAGILYVVVWCVPLVIITKLLRHITELLRRCNSFVMFRYSSHEWPHAWSLWYARKRVHYSFQQRLNNYLIVLPCSFTALLILSGWSAARVACFPALRFLFSFSARVRSFLILSANGTQDGRKRAFLRSAYNFHADGQTDGNGAILERLTDCGRADLLTVCGAADRSRSRSRTDREQTRQTERTDRTDGKACRSSSCWSVRPCFFRCPVLLYFRGLERE